MRSKTDHSQMFIQLRKQTRILLVVMFSLLFAFFALSIVSGIHQRQSVDLIQVVAKQRMLTQKIAKDASRVSVLFEAKSSPERVEPIEVLESKITEAKLALSKDISEYAATSLSLGAGYVVVENRKLELRSAINEGIKEDLKEIDFIWKDFKASAEVIIKNQTNDKNSRKALIFINANSDKLLNYNDMLVKDMIHLINEDYIRTRNLLMFIIIFTTAVAILTVNRLYLYLYKPLDIVFMGFHQIGLMDYGQSKNRVRNSLKDLTEEAEKMFVGVHELIALMENINYSTSFKETLNYIFKTFSPYVPYSHVGVALINSDSEQNIVASYGVSMSIHAGLAEEFMGYAVDLNETSLMAIASSGQPRVINDYGQYFKNRKINKYSEIILKYGIRSSITLPLMSNNKHLGFIFFSSSEADVYEHKHVQFLKTVGNAIAVSMEKNVIVDDLVYSSVLALAKLAEARDEDTGSHLQRMRDSAVLLAKLMMKQDKFKEAIDAHFISEIDKFSPMHDIGKVGVADHILLKPGKLSEEEYAQMKYHTLYGAEVLMLAEDNVAKNGRSIFKEGIAIAGSHHEKWDGSGYPKGLVGDEIPLSARIVAVADVLDALMTKRPYKEAFSFEKSVEIILKGKGSHFDPSIIDVFENHLSSFRRIYESD